MGDVVISSRILRNQDDRLLVGLRLEIQGMTPVGESCFERIKREHGFTGTRKHVYKLLLEKINGRKAIHNNLDIKDSTR